VAIFTVEGNTLNPDSDVIHHFLLQCKSWILIEDNKTEAGKCRGLRVGGNYNVTLDGIGNVLFPGDKPDQEQTDPLYRILEEKEQSKYHH
jgi:hypothetical protein